MRALIVQIRRKNGKKVAVYTCLRESSVALSLKISVLEHELLHSSNVNVANEHILVYWNILYDFNGTEH